MGRLSAASVIKHGWTGGEAPEDSDPESAASVADLRFTSPTSSDCSWVVSM